MKELTSRIPGFNGGLVEPGDPGYEDARAVYNALIDRRPALIARPRDTADVAAAIAFARERGLLLAVRGGGHNGAGLGTCDGGLVLDLAELDGIDVDPDARTVRCGGGCTWGAVDRATGAHGLATPSGIISTTGVGGLTLGGGLGHLTRAFGLAIDNLLEAEVVLADGRVVRASEDSHADLFWALRGGGGNFGVVTEFTFRLHAVGTVIGGPTFWDIGLGAEVLAAYHAFLPSAPRSLNGFFAFCDVPAGPPFPEPLHGRRVCGVIWCAVGDDAAAAMAPLLDALPEPLLHGVAPMPHADLQSAFDALYPPGEQWYWRADFFTGLSEEAIALHAGFGAQLPTAKSTMHLYPVDGAAHDRAASDTAWAYRDATYAAVYAGVDPDPANVPALTAWCQSYQEALHPHSAGGAYVNMMMDEGRDRVRASYRGNYERLRAVKLLYDPANLFCVNQNVEPEL